MKELLLSKNSGILCRHAGQTLEPRNDNDALRMHCYMHNKSAPPKNLISLAYLFTIC